MCPAVAEPTWVLGDHGPTLGWVSRPVDPTGLGVLLLPALGYEYSTSHRAWRMLAEELADRGALVLRLDLPGTADSAEPAEGLTGIDGWRAAVHSGATWLRAAGVSSIGLGGIRWGATLALLESEAVDAQAVLAVAPVSSGKRYVRELRLLGLTDPVGGVSVGGALLPGPLLTAMTEVEVTSPAGVPVREMIKPGAVPLDGAWLSTEELSLLDVLDRPAEEAVVDRALLVRAADWLVTAAITDPGTSADLAVETREEQRLPWQGHEVVERVVTVGPDGLVGVLTSPADRASRDVLVLLNSGSDPHTGPGRAWVDVARGVATPDGWSTLRVDCSGWGESPDVGNAPGRPWDRHMAEETRRLVAALRAQGWQRVVLGGLCAGAWVALQVAREADVELDGVIALNSWFFWDYGDPILALVQDTIAYRTPTAEFEREQAMTGHWDAEDARGLRPPPARWLDELVERGRPVALLFSGDDPGLPYLQDRLGARLRAALSSGVVSLHVEPDLDHGLHRTWLRDRAVAAFAAALERARG